MEDAQELSPFADDGESATQLLQGLISPAPAQALVPPPPDTPPPSKAGQSTPVTGSLATPPSQATPKVSPAPVDGSPDRRPGKPYLSQDQNSPAAKNRSGLARYFSVQPLADTRPENSGQPASSGAPESEAVYVKVESGGQTGYLPKANLKKAQQRDKNLKVLS